MSQDFTQDELKKLAGIAGVVVKEFMHPNLVRDTVLKGGDYDGSYWQPHKDLNQAFECLEGLGFKWTIEAPYPLNPDKFVRIHARSGFVSGCNPSLCIAICSTVLEAAK